MTRLPDPAAPLSAEEAARAFDLLFDGDLAEAEIAGFLVTMARRGESAVRATVRATATLRRRDGCRATPDGRAAPAVENSGAGQGAWSCPARSMPCLRC